MRKKSLMLAAVLAAGVMMAACGRISTLPDNSQDKPVASQQTESKYSFELKGIELKTDGDLTEYTSKLGEPSGGYYEAKSCAFEGMDKFYYYDSVTLQGYQKDGNDKLYSITLMDDLLRLKKVSVLAIRRIRLYQHMEVIIQKLTDSFCMNQVTPDFRSL